MKIPFLKKQEEIIDCGLEHSRDRQCFWIITKKDHSVVYYGQYPTKQEAESALAEKGVNDCQIEHCFSQWKR